MQLMMKIFFIGLLVTGCINQIDINPHGQDAYQVASNGPSLDKLEQKLIKEAVLFCRSTKTTMIPVNIEKVEGVNVGNGDEPPVNSVSVIFKCLSHKQIQALKNEQLRARERAR